MELKGSHQRPGGGDYDNMAFDLDTDNSRAHQGISMHEMNDQFSGNNHSNLNDFDDDDEGMNSCANFVAKFQKSLSTLVNENWGAIKILFYVLLLICYFVYFGFAMHYEFGSEGSWRLMVCTVLGVIIVLVKTIRRCRQKKMDEKEDRIMESENEFFSKAKHFAAKLRISIVLPVILVIGFIVFLAVDIIPNQPTNLISLAGMAFFIASFYIFSFNPSKVKWRPVFWGLAIQLIFALMIQRTTWGYEAFKWLGDRVSEFLVYTDKGSEFLFGKNFEDHYFAFKVLPVIVFFSTCVAMLYYLGVMQVMIRIIGQSLSVCLGTSPMESVNAAGNIFVGQTEAPLMIRPFLNDMTNSEIHAVMTGGFATIAGGVMAAYILYDVPANHLLSASVMSAPAALAMSKLFYPETKKTQIQAKDVYRLTKGEERNLVEAASNGASMSISLVANVAVNLIAFVSLLAFVNATLVWFGDRVGYGDLTFQNICSYVFWPLAYLMGVEKNDCRVIAELIGIKTILNEFVAYIELSKYIHNREDLNEYIVNATKNLTQNLTGIWYEKDGGIFLEDTGKFLANGLISERSVVIATYALCGFSNISSIGIQLGALGSMAPKRKGDMARIVFRAMLAGNVACFMTACISGLLYMDS